MTPTAGTTTPIAIWALVDKFPLPTAFPPPWSVAVVEEAGGVAVVAVLAEYAIEEVMFVKVVPAEADEGEEDVTSG